MDGAVQACALLFPLSVLWTTFNIIPWPFLFLQACALLFPLCVLWTALLFVGSTVYDLYEVTADVQVQVT